MTDARELIQQQIEKLYQADKAPRNLIGDVCQLSLLAEDISLIKNLY